MDDKLKNTENEAQIIRSEDSISVITKKVSICVMIIVIGVQVEWKT